MNPRTYAKEPCCDGVQPTLESWGNLWTLYAFKCPRCHLRGPRRHSIVRAIAAWNRKVRA